MTTVTISLSQSTATTLNALRMKNGESTLGQVFDLFFKAGMTNSTAHPVSSTISLNGSTARLDYSDGGSTTFNSVVLANPDTTIGTATATLVNVSFPTHYQLSFKGLLNFEYNPTSLHSTGGNISAASIQSLIPITSSSYDSTLGNVVLSFQGALSSSATTDFSGVVTSLDSRADHFSTSNTSSGTFNISGNGLAIDQHLATTSVGGTLSSHSEQFNDGSFETVSSASIPVTGSSFWDERIYADAGNFPDNDQFDINLPATIFQSWAIASGAGNDVVAISGGGALLSANLGDGVDTVVLKDFGHTVDGGAGMDTAIFSGARTNYALGKIGSGWTVSSSSVGVDILTNIERLQFADKKLAFDLSAAEPAGQALAFIGLMAPTLISSPSVVGLILGLFDQGNSLHDVCQLALDVGLVNSTAGSGTNAALASMAFRNVIGSEADTGVVDMLVSYMDGRFASYSQAEFMMAIAGLEVNLTHIGLVGLQQTGVEYL